MGLAFPPGLRAESSRPWTLDSSVQRVLEVSPEIKTAEAEIGKKQGALEQAGAWPNPGVDIQVDDKLGIEDGSGGYDLTRLAISQALPLGRLSDQHRQAAAALAGAEAQRLQQQLVVEYKLARRFHALQLAEAKLQLAEMRQRQASRYQQSGKDPLIRYLKPLERMRLDIVLQSAKQRVDVAEGEFNEASISFKNMLMLPLDTQPQLAPLQPVRQPDRLAALEALLQRHPALQVNQHALASALAGIDVAKSQRFADPTITLYRERNYFTNREQDVFGVVLNIQVPLWNMNNGRVTEARQTVYQVQSQSLTTQRELRTTLHKSYLHLGHLIKQAGHYHDKLLQPAERVFELTRKGFDAGELNILTLIDANNTYFDAKERYLELLEEGWLELAEVRRSAGLSLLKNNSISYSGEVTKP